MSWPTHIFVGTSEPVQTLIDLLETEFGGQFTYPDEDNPHLAVDRTDVFVGPHEFEDDTIEDIWVPLGTAYTHAVEVMDAGKDLDRQHAVARRIYDTLNNGQRRRLYLDNLQHILDSYDPSDQQTEPHQFG